MRRKLGGFAAGILFLIGLAPVATAAEDHPPPGCDAFRSSILAGERIVVYCDYLPYPPYLYRVVAHCAAGSSYWYELGYWVEPGFGPSVADCHGGLLSVARVVGYHIDER
jgi:hypothetical protein